VVGEDVANKHKLDLAANKSYKIRAKQRNRSNLQAIDHEACREENRVHEKDDALTLKQQSYYVQMP
jgi:hypothetical protein